jgi:hypothetical protein
MVRKLGLSYGQFVRESGLSALPIQFAIDRLPQSEKLFPLIALPAFQPCRNIGHIEGIETRKGDILLFKEKLNVPLFALPVKTHGAG